MGLFISSSLATASVAAANSGTTQAARAPQPTTNNSADTVQLSASQQVYQLYNQGQTVSQISSA